MGARLSIPSSIMIGLERYLTGYAHLGESISDKCTKLVGIKIVDTVEGLAEKHKKIR